MPVVCALLLVVFSVVSLAACEDAMLDTGVYGIIQGTVIHESSGERLVDAAITTSPPSNAILSDENGEFEYDDLPVGDYTISVTKPGYERSTVSVAVREERITQATVVMSKGDEEFSGEADVDITNWWNTSSNDSVFVEVEYRITNSGQVEIGDYDITFRAESEQGEFFHVESGEELRPGQTRIGNFEKYIRQEDAEDVEIYDVWLGRPDSDEDDGGNEDVPDVPDTDPDPDE
jgi:hypothetical protein